MWSDKQLSRLLGDVDKSADEEVYLFMDDHENVIDSEFLANDEQALRYARAISAAIGGDVFTLRYICDVEGEWHG